MTALDKQALRISELEELNELLREKVKKLESDLWDKEQLRQVYSEKSLNLDSKVRELEARNQKDFVWRGREISRLNDEVDELKEKLEAAEQANKLAQEATEKLVQERIALVAENTALKKSEVEFNEYCRRECEDVGDTWVDDFTETPATDAFLAEVRAQGVEMFSEKFGGGTLLSNMVKEVAADFAAKLRKGVAQ
uniref:Eae protein n=2 Tax=Salmonella enterica TaxID=28901 RepID=A0A1S7BGD3_SALDE|nr:Eae protein [Salmonella enterica subsp. enterica serovar Derby]